MGESILEVIFNTRVDKNGITWSSYMTGQLYNIRGEDDVLCVKIEERIFSGLHYRVYFNNGISEDIHNFDRIIRYDLDYKTRQH